MDKIELTDVFGVGYMYLKAKALNEFPLRGAGGEFSHLCVTCTGPSYSKHAVLVVCNKGTREYSGEHLVLGSVNAF